MLTSRQRSSLSLLATVRPVRLVRLTPTRARLNASPNPNPDADPNPNPNPNPAGGLDGRQGDGPDEGSNEDDTSMAAVLPVRHSSELPLAMHAEWLPGHCGTTSEQGAQCRHGDSQGAAAGVRNLSACLAFCAGCPRCRFISYSEIGRDCSWYNACDTSRLQRSWLRHRIRVSLTLTLTLRPKGARGYGRALLAGDLAAALPRPG